MPNTQINIIKANEGDAIVIKTYDSNQDPYIILIDGGPTASFKNLVKELDAYPKIDLIILTHIDHDHIGGVLKYLKSAHAKKKRIDLMLLNAPNLVKAKIGKQISTAEGIELEKYLAEKLPSISLVSKVYSRKKYIGVFPNGIDIKILSPNKEAHDFFVKKYPKEKILKKKNKQISIFKKKVAKSFENSFDELVSEKCKEGNIKGDYINASSIAFSIHTKDFNGLFLGDAHPSIVVKGMKLKYDKKNFPIKFDYVKLSHHGSKNNTSNELLDCIECYNYIISTNGGKGGTEHPNREVFAKVISHKNMKSKKVCFYSNYTLKEIQKKTGQLFRKEELALFDFIHKNVI